METAPLNKWFFIAEGYFGTFVYIGIIHPEMNICWKSTHPQWDDDEFVSSSE